MSPHLRIALATLTIGLISASEAELRLGSEEFATGVEFRNRWINHGGSLIDEVVARPWLQGRWLNIGANLDAAVAMGSDENLRIDAGEIGQIRLRIDYLFEQPESFQLLPFYKLEAFPSTNRIENANWLGTDFWWMSPFEGLEVGGTIAIDIGDEHGWYGQFGARQFYQKAPLDLQTWQHLTFGPRDFHSYAGGAAANGFTTAELGGKLTQLLPWESMWVTLRAEMHLWLQKDDRDVRENDAEFVLGGGFEYRL